MMVGKQLHFLSNKKLGFESWVIINHFIRKPRKNKAYAITPELALELFYKRKRGGELLEDMEYIEVPRVKDMFGFKVWDLSIIIK